MSGEMALPRVPGYPGYPGARVRISQFEQKERHSRQSTNLRLDSQALWVPGYSSRNSYPAKYLRVVVDTPRVRAVPGYLKSILEQYNSRTLIFRSGLSLLLLPGMHGSQGPASKRGSKSVKNQQASCALETTYRVFPPELECFHDARQIGAHLKALGLRLRSDFGTNRRTYRPPVLRFRDMGSANFQCPIV
eukprot:2032187-Rhodomonas_salina.1